MQAVQPLGVQQAAAPKAGAGREQAGAAERPSFRSSMERAGQEAAEAAQDAQAVEAAVGQEPAGEEGLEAEAAQAQQDCAPEAAGPRTGAEAMEGLLPLVQGSGKKQPGEDVPVENEAEMAVLAALLAQQGGEKADLPAEPAQETPVLQPAQEGAQQTPATVWQGAVPQEGERQAASKMEAPAAQATLLPENENTLTEAAPAPVATMAQAAQRQPRERDMAQAAPAAPGEAQQAPAFGAQQPAAVPVADLTAQDGGPLPAPQARQALQNTLFEQVQSAVNTGKQELFVQLKPESLGGLVIHLAMTEEGLKAQVRTSSENIQHLVTGQIAQLEDALRARDIPVVQMDVIYDQTASGSFLNQQRQAWQESGGRGRGPLAAPLEETAGLYEAALAGAGTPAELMGSEGVVYSA